MGKKTMYSAAANREKRKSDLTHFGSSHVSCIMPAVIFKPVSYASAAWCSTHNMRVFATDVSDSSAFVLVFCTHISKIKESKALYILVRHYVCRLSILSSDFICPDKIGIFSYFLCHSNGDICVSDTTSVSLSINARSATVGC